MICPHCGAEAVAHDHTEGTASPEVGDVSICPGCRCLSVFAFGPLGLFRRKPTASELAVFMADSRLRAALAALAEQPNSYAAVRALRRQANEERS